jgi:hypothetical protein
MLNRTRILTAALAAAALAGGAAGAAAAQASATASTAQASTSASTAQASAPAPRQLTVLMQRTALQFFGDTGPIPFPTETNPLVPGDRVIGQGRILQGGAQVGRDNEACTVAFTRDVLCQDIAVLPGRGDLQTSWTFRWPATGQPPASFDGIIDGGTGAYAAANGTFHAQNQPNGERLTLTFGSDG